MDIKQKGVTPDST